MAISVRNRRAPSGQNGDVPETASGRPGLSVLLLLLAALCAILSSVPLFAAQYFGDGSAAAPALLRPILSLLLLALFLILQAVAAGFQAAAFGRGAGLPCHFAAPAAAAVVLLGGYFVLGRFDLPAALFCAAYGASGLFLHAGRKAKRHKTARVLRAAIPLIVFACAWFCLRALGYYGYAAGSVGRYIAHLEQAASDYAGPLAEYFIGLNGGENASAVRALVSDEAMKIYGSATAFFAETYRMALTALIKVAFAVMVSFLCVCGFFSSAIADRAEPARPDEKDRRLTATGIGSFAFVVCTFVTTLFVSLYSAGAGCVLALSLRIIYTPLLFAIGLRTIWSWRKKARSHPILAVILVVLTVLQPLIVLPMLGVVGNASQRVLLIREQGGGPDVRIPWKKDFPGGSRDPDDPDAPCDPEDPDDPDAPRDPEDPDDPDAPRDPEDPDDPGDRDGEEDPPDEDDGGERGARKR